MDLFIRGCSHHPCATKRDLQGSSVIPGEPVASSPVQVGVLEDLGGQYNMKNDCRLNSLVTRRTTVACGIM